MGAQAPKIERWKAAVADGQFGIWDLDPLLDLVHYPSAWKQRLGFPEIFAPDHTWFWRCRVHPDDLGAMMSALHAHLDGFSDTYEARFRLRSNGSGYRCVVSRGRVVARDDRGQATRMVGTMIDVTQRSLSGHGLNANLASSHGVPPATSFPMHLPLSQAGLATLAPPIERVSDLLDLACDEALPY